MAVPNALSKFCQYMWDHYSKDGGKLLVHMGAASWVLSAFAQIGMLLGDKNIDKKQKKFLLPQEAADAAANVVMYYSICDLIKKGADKLVEKGKFLTDDVVNALMQMKPQNATNVSQNTWRNLFTPAELKGNLSKLLENASNLNIVKNATGAEKTRILNAAEKALEAFEGHKNNVGTIAAIAASVLACNVVTPIVRNELAARAQKKLQHKEDVKTVKQQIARNITMKNPLPHSFKSFNNYNSFSGIKI